MNVEADMDPLSVAHGAEKSGEGAESKLRVGKL